MMSLAEQRKQAVIRNLQRLRAIGALTEAQEVEMHKKYNTKDKATLESEQQALERFILADEKRSEEERHQKAWSRSRPLFSRHISDSDDSDWVSTGDEWFPLNPLPFSQSKRSRKQESVKVMVENVGGKAAKINKSPS
ncbi:unnamed protein product, partial [Hymenolepis diminuta]